MVSFAYWYNKVLECYGIKCCNFSELSIITIVIMCLYYILLTTSKFLLKYDYVSTFVLSLLLLVDTNSPAFQNNLSLGIEVAGIHTYVLAMLLDLSIKYYCTCTIEVCTLFAQYSLFLNTGQLHGTSCSCWDSVSATLWSKNCHNISSLPLYPTWSVSLVAAIDVCCSSVADYSQKAPT